MLGYFLIVVVCLLVSGFFSGSETALLRVNPNEMDTKSHDTKKISATAVKALLKSPSNLLVTILLGNNVVNILGASCASILSVHYFGEKRGVIISTAVMTFAVLILSEIFPKALASRAPQKMSLLVALPLYMVHQMSRPIHFLFERFLDPIITWFVGPEKDSAKVNAYDALLRLASQIRAQSPQLGPISIIQSTVKAQELHAEDVMIPKSEVFSLSIDESISGALKLMLSHRFTRAPVYVDSLDTMKGMVHFKDLVEASGENSATLMQIIRPVLRVPKKKPILPLLSDMQKDSIHMAIVKDEFGNTLGIVTQEDIIEELVGEIRDEFDSEELGTIHKVSDNCYRVLAKVPVRDFNRTSMWNIPSTPSETVGGLLFNRLGRVPKNGESILIAEYELKVEEMSGNRISLVRIKKVPEHG